MKTYTLIGLSGVLAGLVFFPAPPSLAQGLAAMGAALTPRTEIARKEIDFDAGAPSSTT